LSRKLTRRDVLRAAGTGLLAGSLTPIWASESAYRLELAREELRLPKWDAEGFKLGFISDFHLTGPKQTDRAIEAAHAVMREKVDVIALGGDFVERRTQPQLDNLTRFLQTFRDATVPVVAVLGNHDYWTGSIKTVVSRFEGTGVRLLRNDSLEIEGVTLVGQDDAIAGNTDYAFFTPDRTSRSLIALLHEPDAVADQPDHVSLQVSGHSHGGQICFPGGQHIYSPGMARNFVNGFYARESAPIYVSRGVGTTGPDYRLFCPPEIAILTLRSA
jgi:uncharacterized protein